MPYGGRASPGLAFTLHACPALLQVPEAPKGAVVLFHGCVHSGYNYFPRSAACLDCRGLPEEMSHTLQALNRGYAGGGRATLLAGGVRRVRRAWLWQQLCASGLHTGACTHATSLWCCPLQ